MLVLGIEHLSIKEEIMQKWRMLCVVAGTSILFSCALKAEFSWGDNFFSKGLGGYEKCRQKCQALGFKSMRKYRDPSEGLPRSEDNYRTYGNNSASFSVQEDVWACEKQCQEEM